jgi:hypothetical protein
MLRFLHGNILLRQVIGVDPNRLSIEAARIRSQGHHLRPDRLLFKEITPGKSLPFADNRFHLTGMRLRP